MIGGRNGLNVRPRPFGCIITPRSGRITAAIGSKGKQALVNLEQYRGETKYRMLTCCLRNDRNIVRYGGDAGAGA